MLLSSIDFLSVPVCHSPIDSCLFFWDMNLSLKGRIDLIEISPTFRVVWWILMQISVISSFINICILGSVEPIVQFVCWSLTSLCHSNGHIETMPAWGINLFTALTRIRSQFLGTQWSTSKHQRVDMTTPQAAQPSGLVLIFFGESCALHSLSQYAGSCWWREKIRHICRQIW